MVTIGLFVVLGLVLFGAAFMTRRRFGVLGLALASGSLLSSIWAVPMVKMIESANAELSGIVIAGYVAAGLVLLPAVLLLFSGPSYRGAHGRLTGALTFALFALTLIAAPLGSALILDDTGRTIYDALRQYQAYIVTIGVALAVLDLLMVHATGGHKSKSKH